MGLIVRTAGNNKTKNEISHGQYFDKCLGSNQK